MRHAAVSDVRLDDFNAVVFEVVIELDVAHSVVFQLRLVNGLLQPAVKSQNLNTNKHAPYKQHEARPHELNQTRRNT